MSDFDKEAEREKLREKYERDRADREATQRMSDLLLKGATMTNTHCNTCGDPLFRMNGTTFCPTCHGSPEAVEGTELEERSDAGDGAETPADQNAERGRGDGESSAATESASAADRSASEPESIDVQASANVADDRDAGETAQSTDRPEPPTRSGDTEVLAREGRTPGADRGSETDRRRPPAPSTDGNLGNARGSLRAAVERFAAEAAAADDPRYAKECLQAAREAAEALDALP